ncbi:MAG: helix-turn-helix transcriptional regulator [Bacteroidota bacterium]
MKSTEEIVSMILLLGSIQGEFLAIFLFTSAKGNRRANRLLAFHILLFSTIIFVPEFLKQFYTEVPHLINTSFPLLFLFGPSLWFYSRFLIGERTRFKWVDALHLIPFLACVAYLLPFYLLAPEAKITFFQGMLSQGLSLAFKVGWALECVHVFAYLIATYYLLYKHDFRLKDLFSNIKNINFSWLRYLVLGHEMIWTTYFVLLIIYVVNDSLVLYGPYHYVFGFAMSAFVYGIGYIGWKQPEFFASNMTVGADIPSVDHKYLRSGLLPNEAARYEKELMAYVLSKKPYKNSNLSLKDLSQAVSIPTNHLSQVLNERVGMNFYDFVNYHRIEEAKQLLSDSDKADFTILEVAYESGFNSKSTFNTAFKKHTKMTPSQFKASLAGSN